MNALSYVSGIVRRTGQVSKSRADGEGLSAPAGVLDVRVLERELGAT